MVTTTAGEAIAAPRVAKSMSMDEIDAFVRERVGRKIRIAGACIGTDAHTVGIDAILNVKGHSGEKGLEYYREIRVVNLGAQVEVPSLVARARAEGADAVLVSQVVTQRDAHLSNSREMAAAFGAPGVHRPLLVVGHQIDPPARRHLLKQRVKIPHRVEGGRVRKFKCSRLGGRVHYLDLITRAASPHFPAVG